MGRDGDYAYSTLIAWELDAELLIRGGGLPSGRSWLRCLPSQWPTGSWMGRSGKRPVARSRVLDVSM